MDDEAPVDVEAQAQLIEQTDNSARAEDGEQDVDQEQQAPAGSPE